MGIHRLLPCLILTGHTRRPFPVRSDFPHTKTCRIGSLKAVAKSTHTKESARRGDVSHSFIVRTAVRDKLPFVGSDSLNAISRKPLTFEYIRRLKKNGQRGRAIEYMLIALLIAFAALQAFFVFGPRAI
jgi:hypothetical protein